MVKFKSKFTEVNQYYKILVKKFGNPTFERKAEAIWVRNKLSSSNFNKEFSKLGFTRLIIRDEKVRHPSPILHFDYLYGESKIKGLNKNVASIIVKASESIIPDVLNLRVQSRCERTIKVAVTNDFVKDVADSYNMKKSVNGKYTDNPRLKKRLKIPITEAGKIQTSKIANVYGARIKSNFISRTTFKDPLKEKNIARPDKSGFLN